MEDCFVIFHDNKLLIVLTGFKSAPLPEPRRVLDWYGKYYAFKREHLTGGYIQSIPVQEMKYEDFSK